MNKGLYILILLTCIVCTIIFAIVLPLQSSSEATSSEATSSEATSEATDEKEEYGKKYKMVNRPDDDNQLAAYLSVQKWIRNSLYEPNHKQWVPIGKAPTENDLFSGWKLHIIGNTFDQILFIFDKLYKYFFVKGLEAKVLNRAKVSSTHNNKLCAIYIPPDKIGCGQVSTIITEIVEHLQGYEFDPLITIQTDKKVHNMIYYRYDLKLVVDDDGVNRKIMENLYDELDNIEIPPANDLFVRDRDCK